MIEEILIGSAYENLGYTCDRCGNFIEDRPDVIANWGRENVKLYCQPCGNKEMEEAGVLL